MPFWVSTQADNRESKFVIILDGTAVAATHEAAPYTELITNRIFM